MRAIRTSMLLAAVSLVTVAQQAPAQNSPQVPRPAGPPNLPILLGTTGACNNAVQGGPCTTQSTLVLLDSSNGALIRELGPVGFTVNGLAWDSTSLTLYATTPPGDTRFHGLITINPFTGAGKPVDKSVVNFGLPGSPSPIHSISVDAFGHMVGWYDEFPPPVGVSDTYVRINQKTGVATEFTGTGINTSQNGVSFGEFNYLWNIDSPRVVGGVTTQTAYLLNPFNGKPLFTTQLSPPTAVALGDFRPGTNLYYGLNFDTDFPPPFPTAIYVVDPFEGSITKLGSTVDDLHTLAFIR